MIAEYCGMGPKPRGNLHSARTRSFSFTKSVKVSFVKEDTSEAEATAALARPRAKYSKVRISTVL